MLILNMLILKLITVYQVGSLVNAAHTHTLLLNDFWAPVSEQLPLFKSLKCV